MAPVEILGLLFCLFVFVFGRCFGLSKNEGVFMKLALKTDESVCRGGTTRNLGGVQSSGVGRPWQPPAAAPLACVLRAQQQWCHCPASHTSPHGYVSSSYLPHFSDEKITVKEVGELGFGTRVSKLNSLSFLLPSYKRIFQFSFLLCPFLTVFKTMNTNNFNQKI